MTEEIDWVGLVSHRMASAMRFKRNNPEDGAFKMKIEAIGPQGQVFQFPFEGWRDEKEKQDIMNAVADVCRRTGAQAAIVTSDMRWLKTEEYCAYFGLPRPTPENYPEWSKLHHEVMAKYDGTYGNLPRQLWAEGLMVAVKGPEVNLVHMEHYTIDHGRVFFDTQDITPDVFHIFVIPQWW